MAATKEIVLGVTASIAIYKAGDIIRTLKEKGCSVTVVMTKEAQELIRPALFAHLSGNKVFCGMFEEPNVWEIEHIALAQKADAIVVAPATANIIAKIAGGICDDLLTCVISATRAPLLICPAMNEQMYLNRITQANIKKLKSLGNISFLGPVKGRLASGRVGVGCLAHVDTIVQAALRL